MKYPKKPNPYPNKSSPPFDRADNRHYLRPPRQLFPALDVNYLVTCSGFTRTQYS